MKEGKGGGGAGAKAMERIRQRQEESSGSSLLDMALSFISSGSPGRQPLKQGSTGDNSSFLDGLVADAAKNIPASTLSDSTKPETPAESTSATSVTMPAGFIESFSLDAPGDWVQGLEPVRPLTDDSSGPHSFVPAAVADDEPEGTPVKTTVDPFPKFLTDFEQYLLGFVTGSGGRKTAMPQSQICVNSVKEAITAGFRMLRLNKPEALPALASEYQRLTKSLNLAYAYCEFGSYLAGYAHVFGDFGIQEAVRVQEELDLGDPGTEDDKKDGTGTGAEGAASGTAATTGDAAAASAGDTAAEAGGATTPIVGSSRYGKYAHFTNLTRKSIRHMLVRQESPAATTSGASGGEAAATDGTGTEAATTSGSGATATTDGGAEATAADGTSKPEEDAAIISWSALAGFSFEQAARVLARLAGLLYQDLFEQLRCIQYGWNGQYGYTMYQVGECTGYLLSLTFDTSLG